LADKLQNDSKQEGFDFEDSGESDRNGVPFENGLKIRINENIVRA